MLKTLMQKNLNDKEKKIVGIIQNNLDNHFASSRKEHSNFLVASLPVFLGLPSFFMTASFFQYLNLPGIIDFSLFCIALSIAMFLTCVMPNILYEKLAHFNREGKKTLADHLLKANASQSLKLFISRSSQLPTDNFLWTKVIGEFKAWDLEVENEKDVFVDEYDNIIIKNELKETVVDEKIKIEEDKM